MTAALDALGTRQDQKGEEIRRLQAQLRQLEQQASEHATMKRQVSPSPQTKRMQRNAHVDDVADAGDDVLAADWGQLMLWVWLAGCWEQAGGLQGGGRERGPAGAHSLSCCCSLLSSQLIDSMLAGLSTWEERRG